MPAAWEAGPVIFLIRFMLSDSRGPLCIIHILWGLLLICARQAVAARLSQISALISCQLLGFFLLQGIGRCCCGLSCRLGGVVWVDVCNSRQLSSVVGAARRSPKAWPGGGCGSSFEGHLTTLMLASLTG